jgi:hypothetical protein
VGARKTHGVLHGGPPSLHGGEAVADAPALALLGVLLRLGRAEVHPHVGLPPLAPGDHHLRASATENTLAVTSQSVNIRTRDRVPPEPAPANGLRPQRAGRLRLGEPRAGRRRRKGMEGLTGRAAEDGGEERGGAAADGRETGGVRAL